MQRTWKRELKEREIVNGDAIKVVKVVPKFSYSWLVIGRLEGWLCLIASRLVAD